MKMIKIICIMVILGTTSLVWSGAIYTTKIAQATEHEGANPPVLESREEEKDDEKRFVDKEERPSPLAPAASRSLNSALTPKPSPEPTGTPLATSSPTPEPEKNSERRTASQLAFLGIVDFFRGEPDPPAANTNQRGFKLLNLQSTPYDSPSAAAKRFWYVIIGTLAVIGASTFMYGHYKHLK